MSNGVELLRLTELPRLIVADVALKMLTSVATVKLVA
jgi:hypothetical protein